MRIFIYTIIIILLLPLVVLGIYCDIRILQDFLFHTYECQSWEIWFGLIFGGTGPLVAAGAANN